jgi:hypothetical protein
LLGRTCRHRHKRWRDLSVAGQHQHRGDEKLAHLPSVSCKYVKNAGRQNLNGNGHGLSQKLDTCFPANSIISVCIAGEQSPKEKGSMSLTVADLAQHIVTLRRLYARVLEADIELLRRAYGESLVDEALRLADEAARQASPAPQELPPESDERVAEALKRVMERR